jgi:hypothetical protein
MVNMDKPAARAARPPVPIAALAAAAVAALAVAVTSVACSMPGGGASASSTVAPQGPGAEDSAAASVAFPAAGDGASRDTAGPADPGGTGGTEGSGGEAEGDVAVDDGTDSAVTEPPAAEIGPGLQSSLVEFGRRYLSFDYRIPPAEQIEPLRELTTAELFAQLAQPMPPALVESLVAEERVVDAELTELLPLQAGVFQLTYQLTVTSNDDDVAGSEVRTLIVSVDPDDRVSDVR